MPRRGNQRRVAAGRKGGRMDKLNCAAACFAEKVAAWERSVTDELWSSQPPCNALCALPLEAWAEVVARGERCLLPQTKMLAQIGSTCKLARALELAVSDMLHLDLQAQSVACFHYWRRLAMEAREAKERREQGRAREERGRLQTAAAEYQWRAAILEALVPVHVELDGREPELARLLGARGERPLLRELDDHSFRDFLFAKHPHSTQGLATVFPQLTVATHACTCSAKYKEIAAYVRSMLVRAEVAPRRMLRRACHLRVEGV